MRKKLFLLPTVIFLCFIFALAALFAVTPKADYSSNEKRYLEDFPEASLKTVAQGEFESGFEDYLADHFPFRNFWVGLNAYYNCLVGNNGADGVYMGKDGYLINAPLPADNRVEANLEAVVKFSRNTNVPVTMMVVPSCGYIMEDKLPCVHEEYSDDVIFPQISRTLGENGVDFVDLRQTFKNRTAKGEELYYRTDHHWTSPGAYTAYRQLCKSLGVKAEAKTAYRIQDYDNFYGTTYSTGGFWLAKPDRIQVWNNKSNTEKNIALTITEGNESETYHSMFFKKHLKEDDKYPVFLDGNHALETVVNSRIKEGRVLVVKDSFCHSIAPFLADSFNTVTMVDMRYYKKSVSDLVKYGNYERVLVIYGIDNFATDSDLVWIK